MLYIFLLWHYDVNQVKQFPLILSHNKYIVFGERVSNAYDCNMSRCHGKDPQYEVCGKVYIYTMCSVCEICHIL